MLIQINWCTKQYQGYNYMWYYTLRGTYKFSFDRGESWHPTKEAALQAALKSHFPL